MILGLIAAWPIVILTCAIAGETRRTVSKKAETKEATKSLSAIFSLLEEKGVNWSKKS
jgi:hypothetical protein